MIQHFLQFVTAVLLVAIFWELCKINGQLKRSIPQISERGQADDADKSRATSPARVSGIMEVLNKLLSIAGT